MIQMTRCVCSISLNVYTSSSTRTTICVVCRLLKLEVGRYVSSGIGTLPSFPKNQQRRRRIICLLVLTGGASHARRSGAGAPTACGGIVVRDPCRAPPNVWSGARWIWVRYGPPTPRAAWCSRLAAANILHAPQKSHDRATISQLLSYNIHH